jgi:hypothetical protein
MIQDMENRLRDLCDLAVAAKDQTEVERLLVEFRIALEDHIRQAKVSLGCQLSVLDDLRSRVHNAGDGFDRPRVQQQDE